MVQEVTQGNGGKAPTVEDRINGLEETISELIDVVQALSGKVDKVEKTAVKKKAGLFGGKRERIAIKDNTTGKVYISKAAVGKALATEAGSTPEDHFAWYKLQAKFPDRFVEASDEEKVRVEAEEKAAIEKLQAEQNAKLAAEEAKEAPKTQAPAQPKRK